MCYRTALLTYIAIGSRLKVSHERYKRYKLATNSCVTYHSLAITLQDANKRSNVVMAMYTREEFIEFVQAVLKRDKYEEKLSEEEEKLVDMAIEYGVGPYDTAYQIQSNRS